MFDDWPKFGDYFMIFDGENVDCGEFGGDFDQRIEEFLFWRIMGYK